MKFWLNKSYNEGYIISKSCINRISSVSIIYFILLRISSLYLPDLISALYLLPINSVYFLFIFFNKYFIISLAEFPSDISIKYLLFSSIIFFLIISKISKLSSIFTFSSNLCLNSSLNILLIISVLSSKPPKFISKHKIPTSVKIFFSFLSISPLLFFNSLIAFLIKL